MNRKLVVLIIFSIAFAFVEAAVVVYLRRLFVYETGFLPENYRILLNLKAIAFVVPRDSILNHQVTTVELVREFFTIVMLFSVAYLSAKTLIQRLGAFLIAFSIWDLFYYIFLKITTNWPKSLFDMDVYFLIPVPWIGPVITPLVISTFLLILGLKLFFTEKK